MRKTISACVLAVLVAYLAYDNWPRIDKDELEEKIKLSIQGEFKTDPERSYYNVLQVALIKSGSGVYEGIVKVDTLAGVETGELKVRVGDRGEIIWQIK